MPGVQIKEALRTLLEEGMGPSSQDKRLKHVNTQFPRLAEQTAPEDYPKVTISIFGHDEAQVAGGNNVYPRGVKELNWDATLHVSDLLNEPLTQGDAWDTLLDDIEDLLRRHPTLNDAVGSPLVDATEIRRETLPPLRDTIQNAYYSNISFKVRELINA